MGFTDIFGGTTIASANATFLSLALVSNLALGWPTEQAPSGNVVADTIEVTASAPGFNISFSDARQVSSGYTTLFNNVGGNSFNVLDALGGAIITVASGTAWVVYLADNSTQGGTWRVFQLGAGVSIAVAAALAGAGLKANSGSLDEQITSIATSASPVAVDASYRAKLLNWTGGVGIANLLSPGTMGPDWFAYVRNSGSGNFTLTPAANQIDGAATKVLAPGSSLLVVSDGTNFWSVGFGTSATGSGAFDFVNLDVSGSGTLALAGSNLNRIGYRFTGILTGDRTIQVPGTIQEYWITNATTGAFNLYVKTAAQANPGIAVVQGDSKILASDGNNVFNAITGTVTFPVSIAQGGTNATAAPAARTNLGFNGVVVGAYSVVSSVGGTANAITGVLTPAPAAYGGGLILVVPIAATNNGPATINISGLGARTILGPDGNALRGGELLITTNAIMVMRDDAAFAILLNPQNTGRSAYKTGDTSRTSNIVLSPDPDLVLQLIGPGSGTSYKYQIQGFIRLDAPTTGFSFGFRIASENTNSNPIIGVITSNSINPAGAPAIIATETGIVQLDVPVTATGGNGYSIIFDGTVSVLGASRALTFEWAQRVSDVNPVTVRAGSYIKATRI